MDTNHDLATVAKVIHDRELRFRSYCRCGWTSLARLTEGGARYDHGQHTEDAARSDGRPTHTPGGGSSLGDAPPTPRANQGW